MPRNSQFRIGLGIHPVEKRTVTPVNPGSNPGGPTKNFVLIFRFVFYVSVFVLCHVVEFLNLLRPILPS